MKRRNGIKNRIKRVVSVMLAAILVLGIIPVPAFAAEGETGDLSWSLSAGVLTISGKGEMPNYNDAVMPPWYDVASAVTRVVVREGVTNIGSLAFFNCEKLSSASIGSTVTVIGDRAFKNCKSLKSLILPSELKEIGEAAFENCASLKELKLPQGLEKIGDYAFDLCSRLKSMVIPASAIELGRVLFSNCTSLTNVTILCPIEKLPDWMFSKCPSLSWVSLPSSVSEIGDSAFNECRSLSTVYYSGENYDGVQKGLLANPATVLTVISTDSVPEERGSYEYSSFDNETAVETSTIISNTDNSSITKEENVQYSYFVNGNPASVGEVSAAGEGADIKTSRDLVSTNVEATIHNSQGWSELADAIPRVIPQDEEYNVSVTVDDPIVNGEDLARFSDKNINLEITTRNGSKWRFDESGISADDIGSDSYNLDYEIEKLEKNNTKIESDTVYSIEFKSDMDFAANVGINVKVGNAYQYVTLYAKTLFRTTELQTTIADENGVAWFLLDKIDKDVRYYAAVNVKNFDKGSVIIPDALAAEYKMDSTLTDKDGIIYNVGERSSSWGITTKQFIIYVLIGFGLIAFISILVIITLSRISKSKTKYMVKSDKNEKSNPIDEDELRMQIMQEMLNEKSPSDKKDSNK